MDVHRVCCVLGVLTLATLALALAVAASAALSPSPTPSPRPRLVSAGAPPPFMIVAFTGPPGAGKSTLAALLADRLRQRPRVRGVQVVNVGSTKRGSCRGGNRATMDVIGGVIESLTAQSRVETPPRADVLLLDGGFYKADVARRVLDLAAVRDGPPRRCLLVVRVTADDDVAVARCVGRQDRPRDADARAIRAKIASRRAAWPRVKALLDDAGVAVVEIDTTRIAMGDPFVASVESAVVRGSRTARQGHALPFSR